MFQTNYYKEDNLYKVDILLTDVMVGVIEAETIEAAINTYIDFEEEYYGFVFSDEERELKRRNAELAMELNETGDEGLVSEIIDINEELYYLYVQSGFDQLRRQNEMEYKAQLLAEMSESIKENKLGGGLND